jgi:hypothetical protein
MECDKAAHVWFGSNLGINFTSNHSNFLDWLFYCVSNLKEEDICFVTAIIYGLWWARNKLVFDNYDMEDKAIIDYAYSSVRDYQRLNKQEPYNLNNNQQRSRNNNLRNHNNQHTKWRKPST